MRLNTPNLFLLSRALCRAKNQTTRPVVPCGDRLVEEEVKEEGNDDRVLVYLHRSLFNFCSLCHEGVFTDS
jgi:hypothetical protein